MADGRRHSVDIPISKTLSALRRVRSLRDPSTNGMSKFSAFMDNVNWETNSNKDFQMMKDFQEGACDNYDILRSETLVLNGRRQRDCVDDLKLNLFGNPELVSCENSRRERTMGIPLKTEEGRCEFRISNQEQGYKHALSCERYLQNRTGENCMILPVNNILSDDNFSSEVERKKHITSRRKYYVKPSVSVGINSNTSDFSSPCPSTMGALSVNEHADVIDCNDSGCGISRYWSKASKVKETNIYSNPEEYPLLCSDVYDEATCYEPREPNPASNEITPYSEIPGNLSEKFRPKSFDDLVGQNVVARTLSGAIFKGRIVSFYLFHGPRGTGKTSAARIFAAALNCLSHRENRPCGFCRECDFFFSGLSKDVKEVDSIGINNKEKIRSLIKSGINPPLSSRFKVFIIDECHMMHADTWATLLSSREYLPQHVVFVMITPDLHKLPKIVISGSQQYYFRKIKDADIASRLEKMCLGNGLDFDQVALDFIAAKSNGSIRDAQMMLEQLSLLGKKITLSMAHELIGIVSDDELLDFLDLALSSDASTTVIRARELMGSILDPMQLITQLANIIMDILAGKCDDSKFEARINFSRSHISLQKLSHALKILLEAEKRLRISKNQTTWLVVALLQLSSVESSLDTNELKLCLKSPPDRDNRFCSTSSRENFRCSTCSCDNNKLHNVGVSDDGKGKLESIWKRVADLCQSNSLKNFLRKQGKMTSLSVNPGLAVAEIEFCKLGHASRAERSWKLIASSLQSLLGCNVEIRIKTAHSDTKKFSGMRKSSFSLFSCSRRIKQKWQSIEPRSDFVFSSYTFGNPMITKTPDLACPIHGGSQDDYCLKDEAAVNLRNDDGNILSTRTTSSCRSFQDDLPKTHELVVNCVKEETTDCRCHVPSDREPEGQPCCFPQSQTLQRLHQSRIRQTICCIEQQNNSH